MPQNSFRLAPRLALAFIAVLVIALLVGGLPENGEEIARLTYASSPDRRSDNADVSPDGSIVVFHSDSDFRSQGIEKGDYNIWRLDVASRELTRISDPLQPGRVSTSAVMSGDGQRIVFRGDGDFLGEGILEKQYQVWLYDANLDTISRVSDPVQEGRISASPVISEDGSTIAFTSDCDFLGEGIEDGNFHVWLYDVSSGELTRITDPQDDRRDGRNPSLSDDGSILVFESDCDFLGEGILKDQTEIWHYDVTTDEYTRVTRSTDPNRMSSYPTVSGDGTRVLFRSDVDFHAEGIIEDQTEIWAYQMATASLWRITHLSDDDRGCYSPSISTDGTRAFFISNSDFLGEGITASQFEAWLFSFSDGTLHRISYSPGDGRYTSRGTLSSDGTIVVFANDTDFFGDGIADQQTELWLWSEQP